MYPDVEPFEPFVRGDLAPKRHPKSTLCEARRVDGQRFRQYLQQIRRTAVALACESYFDPPQNQVKSGMTMSCFDS